MLYDKQKYVGPTTKEGRPLWTDQGRAFEWERARKDQLHRTAHETDKMGAK